MIQISKERRGECPEIKDKKGNCKITAAVNTIKALYDSDAANFDTRTRLWKKGDIDNKIYGHKEIKNRLKESQYGKCAFCERNVEATSSGDVEHFRPKKAWVQNEKEDYNGPGYYWLSYNYDNLLFACEICNRRNKENLFPLRRPQNRVLNHHQPQLLQKEKPFFINPIYENPREKIRFVGALATGVDKNHRGKKTIAALGLNRKGEKGTSNLYELRYAHFRLVQGTELISKLKPSPQIDQNEIDKAISLMNEMRSSKAQYSAMVNDNFPV
ncbi:MAG: hypothetical protein HWD84_10525 [Flavobacteriaceae bacterium]|nr:hypothetical protein [Flavobacteriaceae bacterium]